MQQGINPTGNESSNEVQQGYVVESGKGILRLSLGMLIAYEHKKAGSEIIRSGGERRIEGVEPIMDPRLKRKASEFCFPTCLNNPNYG